MTMSNIFNSLFKNELFMPLNCSKLLSKRTKNEFSSLEKEKEDILFRLNDTKMRLYIVENAFNHELRFDLIDAYIHEINALRLQYSHLIKQAKKLQITNNYILEEEY